MAVKSLEAAVGNWNNSMPFPKDAYVLHCVNEELKLASTGTVMLVREWEIVSPETITAGDKVLNVAGTKVNQMAFFKISDGKGGWDTAKSDKSFAQATDELKVLGFEGTEVDDENPPLVAKGKTVNAVVFGKEDTQRKAPTKEQLAKGIKQGDPILVNGKEVKYFQLNVGQIVSINSDVKIDSGAF